MGNGSRLAFSCRASDFQERITDVKREMAVLSFTKCHVYSQCEICSVRGWGNKHCLLVEGNRVYLVALINNYQKHTAPFSAW